MNQKAFRISRFFKFNYAINKLNKYHFRDAITKAISFCPSLFY